jgi:hypothetical protein
MQQMPNDAMAYNVSHVCDVAPRPTRPRGHVAERRAAEPEAPSWAPMHIRAVMRSCAMVWAFMTYNKELNCRPVSDLPDLGWQPGDNSKKASCLSAPKICYVHHSTGQFMMKDASCYLISYRNSNNNTSAEIDNGAI